MSTASANATKVSTLIARGMMFQQKGKLQNAVRAYDDAIRLDMRHIEARCRHGEVLAELGRLGEALFAFDQAISLAPWLSDTHDRRGVVLAQTGRMVEALAAFEQAVTIDPGNRNAANNRANALKSLGRITDALDVLDELVRNAPDFAAARSNRALVLAALDRHEEALAEFDTAIACDPGQPDPYCNRGAALMKLGRPDEAAEALQRALALDPRHAGALSNLGELYAKQGRLDDAMISYRKILALDPNDVDANVGLGRALLALRQFADAGTCYQEALKQDVSNIAALLGLANALLELDRLAEAIVCYDHCLSVDPNNATAHHGRGIVLGFLGDAEEALASYERAHAIDPAHPGELMTRCHAAMRLSLWDHFDEQVAELRRRIAAGGNEGPPFALLALTDDAVAQRRAAETFSAQFEADHPAEPLAARYPRRDRIRVGYFSSDFQHHATTHLFIETLEAHDRDRIELFAFSFGHPAIDEWRRRVTDACDRFLDVRHQPDAEIVRQARELEIDIAIDLKGYTKGCRPGIFLHRAAPIQVSYLGYPGTSGMPTIDYLLADEVLVPERYQHFYSEKIAYLPGCYQPNVALTEIPRVADRHGAGLPDDAFVFCCFNQNYKITPEIFAVWMAIVGQVQGSVLWLWVDHEVARQNLRRNATSLGIAEERLVFAERAPSTQHLDRVRLADLFLDTLPCNAHTTASDALRMGLPLLTCAGQSFASRVSASLLTMLGLPELIASDLRDYQRLAVELATDTARLAAIRSKLLTNRSGSRLFDPRRPARGLEAAYARMYARHHDGRPPDHIHI